MVRAKRSRRSSNLCNMGGYSFTSTGYYAESPSARSPVGLDGMDTHGDVDAVTCDTAPASVSLRTIS